MRSVYQPETETVEVPPQLLGDGIYAKSTLKLAIYTILQL